MTQLRNRMTDLIRRRRRPLAAVAAFVGVAAALLSLTSSPTSQAEATTNPQALLAAGHVAVPVKVATGADLLTVGNRVDLVARDTDDRAVVLAHDAVVIQAAASGTFSGSGSTVLVGVTREEGLALAAQPAQESVSVMITER